MKKFIAVIFSLLMIQGCLTLGPKGVLGDLPALTDPSVYSEVYIIRKNKFSGKGLSYKIKIDDKDTFGIKVKEYIKLKLNPGKHTISVTTFGGMTPTTKISSVEIEMESSKKYYFLVVSDVVKAVTIAQITEEEAQTQIAKSKLVFEK